MTIEEAIAILKHHNEWRRGADIPMEEPKVIGEAIDTVVNHFRDDTKKVLTWQDVKMICKLEAEVSCDKYFGIAGNVTDEEFYSEVLRRFLEGK